MHSVGCVLVLVLILVLVCEQYEEAAQLYLELLETLKHGFNGIADDRESETMALKLEPDLVIFCVI